MNLRISELLAIATFAVSCLLGSAQSPAQNTTQSAPASGSVCNGVYDGTFNGNMTVSAGQDCAFLNGGRIAGNVNVVGGNFVLNGAAVGGNLTVNGGGTFMVGPAATIGGNLQVQNIPSGNLNNYTFTTIDVPGGNNTAAYGINDAGQIVGSFASNSGTGVHGFLDAGGVFTQIDVPGGTYTEAYGINNIGQIVGWYQVDGSGQFGFVDTGGSFSPLQVGPTYTIAHGINDLGAIVGYWNDIFRTARFSR